MASPARKPRKRKSNGASRTGAFRRWIGQGDRRTRLFKLAFVLIGPPATLCLIGATYFWISYGHMIDRRLGGEQRPVPRIFGRPFELRPGEGLSPAQLEQRLNDVAYAKRARPEQPGQFSVA